VAFSAREMENIEDNKKQPFVVINTGIVTNERIIE